MQNKIWCFWTGSNPITENRKMGLENMRDVLGMPVELVTKDNLNDYLVDPIPEAYQYLSETHKADFLRFYFMHHYGGGYVDIKCYTDSWEDYFKRFEENPKLEIIGTREKSADGVFEFKLQPYFDKLLCFGWFIMRDHTMLSQAMYNTALNVLEIYGASLKLYPSKCPRDKKDLIYPDGTVSKYPLRWGKIGGSVFHPAIYHRMKLVDFSEDYINYDLPEWNFNNNYI